MTKKDETKHRKWRALQINGTNELVRADCYDVGDPVLMFHTYEDAMLGKKYFETNDTQKRTCSLRHMWG